METILAVLVFGLAMLGMSVGVMLSGRRLAGSCGGPEVLDANGEPLSCGACPKAERELCPSDDELVRIAQLAHPNPDHHR